MTSNLARRMGKASSMLEKLPWASLVFWSVIGLVTVAYAFPIWLCEIPPGTDLHAHLAIVAIMKNLGDPGHLHAQTFQWGPFPLPNALYYTLTYCVAQLFELTMANRLVLTLYVMSYPLALVYFLDTFKRDRWLTLFGFLLIYNFSFVYGFIDYSFSIPLMLFGIATARRFAEQQSLKHFSLVAGSAALLFFTHLQTFVIFNFLATTLYLLHIRKDVERSIGFTLWREFKRLSLCALTLIPALLLFLPWFWNQFVDIPEKNPDQRQFHKITKGETHSDPIETRLKNFANLTLNPTKGDEDSKALMLAFLVGLAALAASRRGVVSSQVRDYSIEVLTILALLFYFYVPRDALGQQVIYQRIAVLVALLGIGWIRRPVFLNPWFRAFFLVLPLLAINIYLTDHLTQQTRSYKEELGDYATVIKSAKPQSTMIHMMRPGTTRSFQLYPMRHLVSYNYIFNGGTTHDSFASSAGRIVQYKKSKRPLNFPFRYNWYNAYPNLRRHYRYVITRDGPQRLAQRIPRYRLVIRRGPWALWEAIDEPPKPVKRPAPKPVKRFAPLPTNPKPLKPGPLLRKPVKPLKPGVRRR